MLNYLRGSNKRTKAIWLLLTVVTVFTFLLGFNFIGRFGSDNELFAHRRAGQVGLVNGETVTQSDWQATLAEIEGQYHQRYGADPQDRDLLAVEQQAWRTVVNERLFGQVARKNGLEATDAEVLVGMRTNPPAILLASPAFQTNGKFDPAKYTQALSNPSNNWAPFEAILRERIPVNKLQERLLASLKLSQPELRQAFLDRYQHLKATVLQVPPADSGRSTGSEAELDKVFQEYRTRMATSARTQLEVLTIPKKYGESEVKTAMDLGQSLYQRALKGEDFAQLAKDYSEGPNAERGGVVDRWLSTAELGPVVGQMVEGHRPGEVMPPYRDHGRVIVFKRLDPARDTAAANPPSPAAVKLAQIVLKITPDTDEMRAQNQDARKVADRAKAVGLAKAAAEAGLSTVKTPWYDEGNMPQQLFTAPAAADWGLTGRPGEVSPVFEGVDEFVIAQVAAQHAAGPPSKEEVADQLKMIADAEHRVDVARPRADAVAHALHSGASLEDAAKQAGLAATAVDVTRATPDPRLVSAPDFQGMLWAAKPGQVVGPVRSAAGWWFGRKDAVVDPPDTLWNDRVKGQVTTEVLTQRQRAVFDGYLATLRAKARVQDQRSGGN